jgi:hypothetical protein
MAWEAWAAEQEATDEGRANLVALDRWLGDGHELPQGPPGWVLDLGGWVPRDPRVYPVPGDVTLRIDTRGRKLYRVVVECGTRCRRFGCVNGYTVLRYARGPDHPVGSVVQCRACRGTGNAHPWVDWNWGRTATPGSRMQSWLRRWRKNTAGDTVVHVAIVTPWPSLDEVGP